MSQKPKIICLTPIKNEEWILDTFLRATSLWADYIIIADQNSEDLSQQIAKKYSKVILISNNNEFNEVKRQQLLINTARTIKGPKILISLDVDEFLSANFQKEWNQILKLPPATVINFKWANIGPNPLLYSLSKQYMPLALVDDNSIFKGKYIHGNRIPLPKKSRNFLAQDIKVMHFQYLNWERMESKQRWYQCLERIRYPQKSFLEIYFRYHHMYTIKKKNLKTIPSSWIKRYQKAKIDFQLLKIKPQKIYWWDKEVLNFLKKYGARYFAKENIWYVDWQEKAKFLYWKKTSQFKDPRSNLLKKGHQFLKYIYPFVYDPIANVYLFFKKR